MIDFFCPGVPVQQGSMIAVAKGIVRHEKGAPLENWRSTIGWYSAQEMRKEGHRPAQGPVAIDLEFVFTHPKAHYRTGRNAAQLKPNAPHYKTTKPDIDKLVRAVLDALTGICFRDDSLIVSLRAAKCYGETAGVWIAVSDLSSASDPAGSESRSLSSAAS